MQAAYCVKLKCTERGHNMIFDFRFVFASGQRRQMRRKIVNPHRHPSGDSHFRRFFVIVRIQFARDFCHPPPDFRLRLPIDTFSDGLPGAWICPYCNAAFP